ncbi:MAG TPA: ATP-binding protein [Bacteroidales bacterium]|nr:ATP-binding protein [Bacteroidales bacterium]MDI9553819.1 ATP-binding protein [Bacteroidota bacterium]MZP66432.1 ATP-binding protein [Bacteroidales bacterium]HNY53587.1 ATP-binding protein [Bacteroidales bacterium]HOG57541.1 ATP-binding protein [Bacteroidales bacterium]
MNIIRNRNNWQIFLFLFAILIGVGSLIYTQFLVRSLKIEERKKVEMWAEATRLINSADSTQNLDFLLSIIENNNTVPVILTDGSDNIIATRNIDQVKIEDTGTMGLKLEKMKSDNQPIIIDLGNGSTNRIYYKDSIILSQLIYYPFIQLGFIILFIMVSYLALSSSRKAEQNRVWLGLSKETAHQLGTPTTSLTGWVELLKTNYPELPVTKELALDVKRLEKVTERFSRIGSKPLLTQDNILALIQNSVNYLKSRSSSKVLFVLPFTADDEINLPVNPALFEWVIENVCKNGIDAMEGDGEITIKVEEEEKYAIIDISDTGKGLPKSSWKKIFSPGYTTKKRGWGLGLSLAKRIIEEYHHGRIFVKSSEPGKGTCIRIMMKTGIV